MTIRTTFIGAALAVAAVMPAAAQELKFANFTPPFHTVNESVIEKLNADLSAATGGAVTVRGYHGGELGAGPVEQYVRAVQGVADITWGLPGYTSSQFQKTMIVELPGAVPEGKCGCDALWDAMDEIKGEFPGTIPVGLWTSEPNIMIMKDKVIRTPADLQGLKIRVAGATAAEVATALGATPVQMPINQVYNALETGLIDGVYIEPSAEAVDTESLAASRAAAADAGIELSVIVLAEAVPDAVAFAELVGNVVPGTVLVFTPDAYGASSTDLRRDFHHANPVSRCRSHRYSGLPQSWPVVEK